MARPFGPLGWFRTKPILAAAVTAVSILLLGTIVVTATPLRCGPAGALGFKNVYGCPATTVVAANRMSRLPTPRPYGNPASGLYPPVGTPASAPYANPASGYPPYGNPASGSYPPQGNPASPSGSYPPFYAPASNGSPVTSVAIDCRLPVYAGPPGSGGFVVFPGSTFIADPASAVALPSPSPGTSPPPQNGPGYGYGQGSGLSYDRTYKKWLPVPINWVSPDGNHYAYISDGVYAVKVADGTQNELREGRNWNIVGVQNQGVYAGDQSVGGLWLFPFSGTPRQITTAGYWQAATSSAAYGTSTSAVPQGVSNDILRLDLATGKSIEWFTRPDTQSSVSGFDQHGNPVINVRFLNGSGSEIWIVTGANGGSPIAGFVSVYVSYGFNAESAPVADSHGIWFAGNYSTPYSNNNANGLALYVPGSGFYWMSGINGQLAGGCS
jgi:hypothetical protein